MTRSCFLHICDITNNLAGGYGAQFAHDSNSISLRFDDAAKARAFEAMLLHRSLFDHAVTAVPMNGSTWIYRFRVVYHLAIEEMAEL